MNELLKVDSLKKYFPVNVGSISQKKIVELKAVDGVSFELKQGEILALVGESGSGKSTTAYTIMGLYKPTEGKIFFKGTDISMEVSKRPLSLKKDIQIVFQDPGTSLNPQRTVKQILELPLRVHKIVPKRFVNEKIEELLRTVELPPDYMFKYPRMIGGGERQMVAIARALATSPSLVILDEPTSALDVSIQAKIINMLLKLQNDFKLSYLFITHDLSLMRNVATRMAIMYLGKINEIAPAQELFANPLHPYTQMLLSSIPVVTEKERSLKPKKITSIGEIPSPVNPPPGCGFHPRCPFKFESCFENDPQPIEVAPGHFVRCLLYENQQKEVFKDA
ncbi:MAG: ABC transporter ATP-binding protein [Nitrososphaerota archaeon]